ncbi:hypothetical protein HGRIS_003499 [Hohenbuehelia grisea]|uniref:Uncharacterized protein n=1 Tax=Hohenbuehelia grisea TaxID=104357 RepID=A0ABR3JG33_9AGAR
MSQLPVKLSPADIKTVINLSGAALIGLVCCCVLYGITIIQTYLYYTNYWSKDRIWIRIMVSSYDFFGVLLSNLPPQVVTLWAFDTLQLITVVHAVWHYLVLNFGDVTALGTLVWFLEIGVTAVIALISQVFFAYRVWRLSSKNMILSCFLVVLSLLSFCFGICTSDNIYYPLRVSVNYPFFSSLYSQDTKPKAHSKHPTLDVDDNDSTCPQHISGLLYHWLPCDPSSPQSYRLSSD